MLTSVIVTDQQIEKLRQEKFQALANCKQLDEVKEELEAKKAEVNDLKEKLKQTEEDLLDRREKEMQRKEKQVTSEILFFVRWCRYVTIHGLNYRRLITPFVVPFQNLNFSEQGGPVRFALLSYTVFRYWHAHNS